RQLKTGNKAACADFYDRFAPVLFSMICAILGDEKEYEHVLEEAFLQMWKGIATYDSDRSSLFTWAVMIARHKAIERVRERDFPGGTCFCASQANDRPQERWGRAKARPSEEAGVRAALSQLNNA